MKKIAFLILISLSYYTIQAQDVRYAQSIIEELCSEKYQGRGYINDGVNKAAIYLVKEFKRNKCNPIGASYFQSYSFPVNTIAKPIICEIDHQKYKVGVDFLVNEGAQSIQGTFNLLHFNFNDSLEKILLFKKIEQGFNSNEALVLHNASPRAAKALDSLYTEHNTPPFIIYTNEKKLTHTIATKLDKTPSIIFFDSLIVNKEIIHIQFENEFIPAFTSQNIIGTIKGKNKDSTIVFSAHYDHLGMQSNEAQFSGASDNASGVSMIMALMKYYSKRKPKYNITFILFSGEEAGLIGSDYFTSNPTFNLASIKIVLNIDIMGNAENGITVVNGETQKKAFDVLFNINTRNRYIPAVNIRSQTSNSDHYHFSQKDVPAVFIYSNGGQGHYHDVYDVASELKLTNFEQVAHLFIDFVNEY